LSRCIISRAKEEEEEEDFVKTKTKQCKQQKENLVRLEIQPF
jgi:hypothetical protein